MSAPQPPDDPAPPAARSAPGPSSPLPGIFLPLLLVWMLWILFSTFGIAMMWVVAWLSGIHGFFDAATATDGSSGRWLALLVMVWTGFSLVAAIVVAVRLHRRLRRLRAAESAAQFTEDPPAT